MPKLGAALITAFAIPVTISLVAPGGGVDRYSGDPPPCPRQTPRSFIPGSVTVVKDGTPPCRLAFPTTAVRLRADPDGARPDPGPMVVRDSRGRFYTANGGWGPVISVWNPHGEYVTSFGREGEGPGELSDRGMLDIFIDGEDRLHVRDGSQAWSVFSPQHEFLRRAPSHLMRGAQRTTVILGNGVALTSNDGYMTDRSRYFRLVDAAGALQETFGPVEEKMSRSRVSLERTLAYGGGDTFWAGPAVGDPRGYLLEEWGVDGVLRRAFRRETSWFDPGDEERRVGVEHLHIDDSGLLYIMVGRVTDDYAEAAKKARREGRRLSREERSALTEAVIEMIDTRTGELLASEAYPVSKARQLVPSHLFRAVKQGAVYREGPDGFPFVDIVSVELKGR